VQIGFGAQRANRAGAEHDANRIGMIGESGTHDCAARPDIGITSALLLIMTE
jgi:hypothetical protein